MSLITNDLREIICTSPALSFGPDDNHNLFSEIQNGQKMPEHEKKLIITDSEEGRSDPARAAYL
ncbi:Uncharacterized protein dnm_061980 [Desulfonema magnum]|uniref:Uncharacterized protein n=1 Tax=Desulfonema magnum TaxID=45655 RepID=A0A975BRK3_9BACT|nr:Uncharacterized protein dnm_061980 [Desulfonema magnum]